jgi:hypothetical protein
MVGHNDASGLIAYSYSLCSVNGNTNIGGFTGDTDYGIINNCYTDGNVTGTNTVGGFIGKSYEGTTTQCYSKGFVSGENTTGGFIGENGGSIKNCYSKANVNGNNTTGGFVGFTNHYSIIYCYSTGHVSAEGANTGGFEGIIHGIVTYNFYNLDTSGQTSSGSAIGKTTEELQTESTYTDMGWNFYYPWKIENGSYPEFKTFEELNISGSGTYESPYEISNTTHLVWLSSEYIYWDKHFKQVADITFPAEIRTWNIGRGFTPIALYVSRNCFFCGFSGSYDGCNFKIDGLYINDRQIEKAGLFAYITRYDSFIKDLKLVNVDIKGLDDTGGLVGYNYGGTITNCYCTGNIKGTENIGGLVGGNEQGYIENCYFIGNVTGYCDTGGLVGSNLVSTIKRCFSTGSVTGEYQTGGFVGYNGGSVIFDCFSMVNVTGGNMYGGSYTGGFAGYHSLSLIHKCYSTGSVEGSNYTGGFVGESYDSDTTNSFWDIETSGQTTSDGGTGKTTEEMRDISTYTIAGWQFPAVWQINPELNNGYPYLTSNTVGMDDNITPTNKKALVLNDAYPNPFNPVTNISFELLSPEKIKINIYNIKGQLVKSLVDGLYDTGKHNIAWDGKDNLGKACGTGTYLYKIRSSKYSQTKKMMLLK